MGSANRKTTRLKKLKNKTIIINALLPSRDKQLREGFKSMTNTNWIIFESAKR